MVRGVESSGAAQRAIAPESPAVQRARRKAQQEQSIDPTVLKTEEATRAIRAIHARQGHNIHEKVSGEIYREEASAEIRSLRATLAAEYQSPEQSRIESIADRVLGN